jgi:peptidoglycan-associated lipoprotein
MRPMSAAIVAAALITSVACHKPKPPVARPPSTASMPTSSAPPPPRPPEPVPAPTSVPPEPVREDSIASASLDDLNKNSPLKPVFFEYDSDELTSAGQQALNENATVLKKYATWAVTIEGHCDERGTAEYNLALGERRAVNARAYLMSLGIGGDRLRTVSYGKEFPFDAAHSETAFSKNRRAHFVITAK